MRDIVLLQGLPGADLDALARRTGEILDAVALAEDRVHREQWVHRRAGVLLIQATPAGLDRIPMHTTEDDALAYTGFVSAPRSAAADVRELVSVGLSGVLKLADSPGGIATFFYVDGRRRRCHVWTSLAGVEGLFVTKGADSIAVSNNPLLSHLAGTQRDVPRFSHRWAHRMLLGGSSLWDDSPFEGTLQPPPRTVVVLRRDQVRHAPHPVRLGQQRFADRDPAGVAALNAAALDAVSVLRRWPRGELELSGGKDSRYVAALLRRAGIEADHITFGSDTGGEGPAASAVAQALGVELQVRPGDVVTGTDLVPVMLANLRRSDGLLSENRQLPYRPRDRGRQPLIQGQAHHPRGGFRTLPSKNRATTSEHLIGQMIGDRELVVTDLVEERRQRLLELLDGYTIKHPADLAYWMYADWRMTRWTIASYRVRSRHCHVVWPMMDERALRVISALSTFDRMSEIAFYAGLSRLSPHVAAVPLYQDTWRFDNGPIGPASFPEGYESRRHPFKDTGGRRSIERRISTVQPLFQMATRDMRHSDELRSLILPGALETMSSHPDPAAVLGLGHNQVVQFMWKAVAIALVMEGEWLRADAAV